MTTANSSSEKGNGNSNKEKNSSGDTKPIKKPKSAGFIEVTGFKPNWLETGPLSPEMLIPPPKETIAPSEPVTERKTPPELPAPQPTKQTDQTIQAATENNYRVVPAELAEQLSSEDLAAIQKLLEKYGNQEITVEDESELSNDPETQQMIRSILDSTDSAARDETLDLSLAAAMAEAESRNEDVVMAPLLQNLESESRDGEIERSGAVPATPDKPSGKRKLESDNPPPISTPPLSPTSETGPASRARSSTPVPPVKKKHDRLSWGLLALGSLLLAVAAIVYFINPFTRLALGSATLARPTVAAGLATPRTVGGDWCVRGDFIDQSAGPVTLVDTGTQGDILSQDRVYSLEYLIPQAGTYQWQVVNCADPAIAYPAEPAWLRTTSNGEAVTLIFDSNEREDPLFFPIPFVVTALDSTSGYRAIGSFQDWNPEDSSSRLDRIYSGLYQQIRQIARPGTYEGYVIDEVSQQAVDAYGRATNPIPFSFETTRAGEYVVFLLDTDRGRASILNNMSPFLAALAFGQGHMLASLALAGLAGLLFLGLLLRQWVLRNRKLWLESGCPQCGEHELMRIARRDSDRYLNVIGIPAYRYRCRHCTWEGLRLSEEGAPVSPGVTITPADIFK